MGAHATVAKGLQGATKAMMVSNQVVRKLLLFMKYN
jgi:hypothetical protein